MTANNESTSPQQLLDAGWRARYVDSQFEMAQDFFARSLELARRQNDKRAIGHALLALYRNLIWCSREVQDAYVDPEQICQGALDLFRAIGDESGVAASLRARGDYAESLEIYRRINDQRGIALCLERLMCVAAASNADRVRDLHDEALPIARQLDDKHVLATVLSTIGICWRDDDQLYRRAVLLEAADLYRKLDYLYNCSQSLQVCAGLSFDEDDHALSADDRLLKERLLEEARLIRHDIGFDDVPR
jgi:tetratricopeptide (TPR) repeat protein